MRDTRPNVLWYCTDQQRFDTIGALGNRHVRTPAIDGLVRDGAAFTHAYCQSPICTPSRASFMTGMYPSRVHNTRNGNETFPASPPLLSKLIADSGYDCGMVGKFHLTSSGNRTEPRLDDGFSYWKFSHAPRDDWAEGHDYADWVRAQGGDLDAMRHSADGVRPHLHQTKWASDQAIEFISRERATPWLACVNIYDPHPPFIPPREYERRFSAADMPGPHFVPSDLRQQAKLAAVEFQDELRTPEEHDARAQQARYYAMVAQMDEQFGRILMALDESGQRDDTLIIFTSDHGDALGDHGLMHKGCRFYEGLTRVPLIFSWPARARPGLVSDALVELLDMSATVVEATGLDQPEYMQGRSLMPILGGDADPGHHRDFVRCEYFDAIDAERADGSGTFATMYRDRRYKLCNYHTQGLGELYDLQEDPWEFEDLWDDPAHASIRHELVQASFNAQVLTSTDVGSRRIAPM